jgi:ATP-dependent RNA helicase DDX56/DBP9
MYPKALSLSHLESLVIDEADLILSYGHDEDLRSIFHGSFLPKVYQTFLMSATMTDDVETLKGLALRNPVCLRSVGFLASSALIFRCRSH